MAAGQLLLQAVKSRFFANFRVSVMFDSNGSNTTAAAAVAKLAKSTSIRGKRAVVLAGTGPVGQRAATFLAMEGASEVIITSRSLAQAENICKDINTNFGIRLTPAAAADFGSRATIIQQAQIVISTGAAGVELLKEPHWRDQPILEIIADANTTPPLGIGGIEMQDRGVVRHGKITWGALGFGSLKLALQRACIARLFEQNDLILDAEEIFITAKEMA